jgi:hypothetical protein
MNTVGITLVAAFAGSVAGLPSQNGYLALHKLHGQSRQSFVVVVSPSIFDGDIAILDKAGLGKPALEVEENSTAHFFKGRDAKKTNHRHCRLPGMRRERPVDCRNDKTSN